MRSLETLFDLPSRADFVIGGQWGSEGKGAAVAWLARHLLLRGRSYSIVTTNASSQAGHTAVVDGKTYVTRHLPTAPLLAPGSYVYLNGGCAIDPEVFEQELRDLDYLPRIAGLSIHPNAAVITNACKAAEARPESAQTKIASTQKGVGEALARKVLRSGVTAADHPLLRPYVDVIDLNNSLSHRYSVLVEVPQGFGLSYNGRFYPHCTSRDCTVSRAMADAGIHPAFVGNTMMVLRTFPIRVGNIPGGYSGDCYPDQSELTWEKIGRKPEVTTVTGRVRRVFSWSKTQLREAMAACRPRAVFLTHCDYIENRLDLTMIIGSIREAAAVLGLPEPIIIGSRGPDINEADLSW